MVGRALVDPIVEPLQVLLLPLPLTDSRVCDVGSIAFFRGLSCRVLAFPFGFSGMDGANIDADATGECQGRATMGVNVMWAGVSMRHALAVCSTDKIV